MPFGMVAQANAAGGQITNCKVIAAADVTKVGVSKWTRTIGAVAGPIGGIVGVNDGTITNCSVGDETVAIRIRGNRSTESVGGIAAVNNGTISLANSYINVIFDGEATYAGGLVGNNTGSVMLGAGVELKENENSTIGSFTYYGGLVGMSTGDITLNEIPTMIVHAENSSDKEGTEYFSGGLVGKLDKCRLTVSAAAQAKTIRVLLFQEYSSNLMYNGGLVGQAVNATVDGGGKLTIEGKEDSYANSIASWTCAGALAGKSDAASTFQGITLVNVHVKSDETKGGSFLFGSGEGTAANITYSSGNQWNGKAVSGT